MPLACADDKLYLTMDQWDTHLGNAARRNMCMVAAAVTRREVIEVVVKMTATTTMGQPTFGAVLAGVVTALERGGASTVVFTDTSLGSALSQGRRRRCSPVPKTSRRSCR